MALFESYERREKQILAVLKEYGINSIEEAAEVTKAAGLDVYAQVEGIQPICFENAKWAYTVGAAIAIKKGCKRAADAAAAIGEGLQAFCIPGSVADRVFRILSRTRVFCCCRRCDRYCRESKQSTSEPTSCYLKWSWKRCCTDHFQNQWIYIC